MKLYVMRHGPAEDHSASGADADRALTESGRDRVCAVAKTLLEAGEEPAGIVTSPLVRAVQTAEIVALVTRIGERQGSVWTRPEMSPGGEAVALTRKLASEGRRRLMVVGHEPDLSALVALLLGSRVARALDKAMVVGLRLDQEGQARLRFVLDPKTLRLETAPAL